jgi:AraC-like DNA-binding protein
MFANSIFNESVSGSDFLFNLIYINNVYFNPLIKLNPSENKLVLQYFENLIIEYSRDEASIQAIQAHLYLILLEIQRIVLCTTISKTNLLNLSTFKKFMVLLENNFNQNKPVNFYSDSLTISESNLNRISKQYAHQSTAKVIQNRILLESKRYLTITSFTINEIAFKVGFDDPSYFIRLFKKQVGITPKDFRDKYKML